MSYSLLNFDNVTFDGKLSNMRTLFAKGATNYEPSEYARQRFMRGQAMRTMDVIYDVLRIYKGDGNIDRFVGKAGDTLISEVETADNKTQVTMLKPAKNGTYSVKGGIIDENDVIAGFNLDADTKKGVMLALMPAILSDNEAKDIYDKMSTFLEWDSFAEDWLYNNHVEDFSILLNKFSTNIESRISYPLDCGDAAIKVAADKVAMLRQSDLKNAITESFVGSTRKFQTQQTKAPVAKKQTSNGFEKSYAYNPDRTFTDEEKDLLAHLPSSYVMPDFVPEICEMFKETSDFPAPMRVAYLLGPAGTGKTEAANAIAAGLGLPIDHYTCNPATEIFDFIGQVFPNTGSDCKSYAEVREELGLPDTEDIVNDPVGAYEKLYGTQPSGFPDEGKLILEMMERVMKYMASTGSGKSFTYVESGLIRAARLGYAFEIQEIGTVLRPGVAVGLNALLETGGNAFITLPTGEVIKKHKDATFIFTSNDEYEGTCNLNQSVLDRMSMVYRIANPPRLVMKERIMARLNFPDATVLERMIDVIYAVSEAAKERGITDGVCGYRSLENWCMATMVKSKKIGYISDDLVYSTAITCVMNKASQKQEYVDELMSSLTTQFAAPSRI